MWNMLANGVNKTDTAKCMLITTFQKVIRLPRTDCSIVRDTVTLDSKKFLGVIVDKYLTWKHDVDKTATIISKNIASQNKEIFAPTKHI